MDFKRYMQLAVVLVSAVICTAMVWALLNRYGGEYPESFRSGVALVYSAVLYGCLWLSRFLPGSLEKLLPLAFLSLAAHALGLVSAFLLIKAFDVPFARMAADIPLILTGGMLVWLASLMVLRSVERISGEGGKEMDEGTTGEPPAGPDTTADGTEMADVIDKITVRDGNSITIIGVEDLWAVGAYGDYVMLHTEHQRHIKEQTMKYFEARLPGSFVRIHRSVIINTDRIARIELLGKETYNVHLRNGLNFRASSSGYKLLKAKLSL